MRKVAGYSSPGPASKSAPNPQNRSRAAKASVDRRSPCDTPLSEPAHPAPPFAMCGEDSRKTTIRRLSFAGRGGSVSRKTGGQLSRQTLHSQRHE